MSPEEICRKLGEKKTKTMFQELTSDGMKKVLREAKIPTTRMASHTSTKKRNDDWANRLWRNVADKPAATTAATLLFEWLTRARRPMLADFLTALEVPHEDGLTDVLVGACPRPEALVEALAQRPVIAHDAKSLGEVPANLAHDTEVAAYLLFLDASNKSEVFAPLELEKQFAAA